MDGDRLQRAYGKRSDDLVEARAALAQAVEALTAQLADRRGELAAFLTQRDDAMRLAAVAEASTAAERARGDALEAALAAAHAHVAELEVGLDRALAELAEARGLRIVRHTAWLRRIVFRLRTWR